MSELMPWLMVAASGLCLAAALLDRRLPHALESLGMAAMLVIMTAH